jgi:hypothetical protein
MTIRDKDRKPLDGNDTYRLNVPANAPVKLYWSATVYDCATHALIRGQPVVEPRAFALWIQVSRAFTLL